MSTQTELPLVLKGLGRAEDALRAADCPGVKAVICSNHGGRNLDGGPASADVLLQVMRHIDPVLHFACENDHLPGQARDKHSPI